MRSFSFLPSRLILVPSAPPVTRPCAFPSHIILVNPSSHTPFYLSVPHHPRQPPSHIPFYLSVPHHPRQPLQSHALVPFRPTSSSSAPSHIPFYLSVPHHPRQPSSHMPFYLFISFNISSHLCVFSPLVLDPRGKCREFPRKRFTFPRGSQGYRLHMPLWRHLPFPPPGKVPGFSAKTVHFPPWPAGVPALQASLAALGISTSGESAGFFGENGSLSPVAGRGTGSTGLSRRTWHFHLQGKCRVFRRKRFTFPRGMRLQGRSSRAYLGKCLVYRHSEKEHLLDMG